MREPLQGGWKRCPVCGKEFHVDQPGMWKYYKNCRRSKTKYEKIYFCSWECIRELEKQNEAD